MSYVYFNPNPLNKLTGDCAIRAVARLTNQSWDDAYLALSVQGLKMADLQSSNHVWGTYLKEHGFRKEVLPDCCPDCYTIHEFCIDHPFGRYAVVTDGHVVAVVNGNYYDSFDSGHEVVIFYWEERT